MTMTEQDLRVVEQDEANRCVHHWLLAEPVDGMIPATCRRCGANRGYSTNPEGVERFDDYREITQASSYYQDRRSA